MRRPKNLYDGRTVLSATSASAREAPVPDKDSSVGAQALEREDGFARRLPQNDSDLLDAVWDGMRQGAIRISGGEMRIGGCSPERTGAGSSHPGIGGTG